MTNNMVCCVIQSVLEVCASVLMKFEMKLLDFATVLLCKYVYLHHAHTIYDYALPAKLGSLTFKKVKLVRY